MEYIEIIISQFIGWLCAFSFVGVKRWKGMTAGLGSGLVSAAILLVMSVIGQKGSYAYLIALILSDIGILLLFKKISGYSGDYAPFVFLNAFGKGMLLMNIAEAIKWNPDMQTVYVFGAGALILFLQSLISKCRMECPEWHEKEICEKKKTDLLPETIFGGLTTFTFLFSLMRWNTIMEYGFAAMLMLGLWIAGEIIILLYLNKRKTDAIANVDANYRKEMETFLNVIRSQRHDYNFHVRTLASVLKQGNIKACEEYVQELIEDSNAMNEVLPVKDPAISATIYNFRVLAGREGIKLHIDLENDLSYIVTNVYETNKIISNLLQNSIDEVKTHRDKSYGIWLYILKRGQFCVIHTANEVEKEMNPQFFEDIYRNGYTTKQGHDGVGLSSIRSLAARYHGVVYSRMENNVLHFVAKIPLKYEATDEDTYRREDIE